MMMRPLTDRDLPMVEDWLYQPHVRPWFKNPEAWLEEMKERLGCYSFIHHFIALEGKPIGFGQYYCCAKTSEEWEGKSNLQGIYSIDYLIGEKDFLHKGYGRQLVGLLVEAVQNEPDVKGIVVQPERDNQQSCSVLEANGFVFDSVHGYYDMNI